MGREVRTYFNRQNEDPRYLGFKIERNGSIAQRIAHHMGLPYKPAPLFHTSPEENAYIVPGVTLDTATAAKLLIKNEADIYGVAVPNFDMIGKSILHQTVSSNAPPFYDSAFARIVEQNGLVLPGITGFSAQDLLDSYRVVGAPSSGLRLKQSNESDGNGQHEIMGIEHLRELLNAIGPSELANHGAIIEPNLKQKRTNSVGFFKLGSDQYVFVADQLNGNADERDMYLGGENIVVTRGEFQALDDLLMRLRDPRQEIVSKAMGFLKHYFEYFPNSMTSRLSVDVLSGSHAGFGKLSGVTDITGRLGGLCPATILAAQHLQDNPRHEAVVAEVHLNYHPQDFQDYEKGAEVFLDQSSLRITAKINIDKVI